VACTAAATVGTLPEDRDATGEAAAAAGEVSEGVELVGVVGVVEVAGAAEVAEVAGAAEVAEAARAAEMAEVAGAAAVAGAEVVGAAEAAAAEVAGAAEVVGAAEVAGVAGAAGVARAAGVTGAAAPEGLASGAVAEGFAAPSKGSSVRVSSAGVESFAPLSESLPRTGVAWGSPVSSCALSSSSGSTRSVVPAALDGVAVLFWSEAESGAVRVGAPAVPSTGVEGVIPRSTSGSINSSLLPRGAPVAGARGPSVWAEPSREGAWTELSRADRAGRPGSRGSSMGRSVRGSSIKRDAASTGSCLVAGYPATPRQQHLPDGSQIEAR